MIRGVDLRGAISINMITMIGIGPLITLALVLSYLHGPLALLGWIAGAIVAMCDGLVWAELASRYPGSGGTYVYLREIFGRDGPGRWLAFLFNWQFVFFAFLIIASGYIGFAQYSTYLFPWVGSAQWHEWAVAIAVGIITIILVYRRITVAEKLSFVFFIAAVGTLVLIIAAGLPHADFKMAFHVDGPVAFGWGFFGGLAQAMIITLYDYAGYNQSALMGDEVIAPTRTIPQSIIISIVLLAILYIALQIAVSGVIPLHEMVGPNPGDVTDGSQYAAATVVGRTWGTGAARAITVMILITAFASAYGSLLGFARIPYAAAATGEFLAPFAKLHPTGKFPYISVLVIGLLTLPACLLHLDDVIKYLTTGIVLIQGIAQIVALFVLRARREATPFRMWLYPVPPLVALAGWVFIFWNSGALAIAFGIGTLCLGTAVYMVVALRQHAWPFRSPS